MIVPPALLSRARAEPLARRARNRRACYLKGRTWEWLKDIGFDRQTLFPERAGAASSIFGMVGED